MNAPGPGNRRRRLFRTAVLCLAAIRRPEDPFAALQSSYEYKMIAASGNGPGVDIQKDHLGDICILLHGRVPPTKISSHFGWTDEELGTRLARLRREGLVKDASAEPGVLPAITVIGDADARRYFGVSPELVKEVAAEIHALLPEIRRRYASLEGFRHLDFRDASFFLLSDVLLDNWQIRSVEAGLFDQPRTPHAGKNYYLAILQKSDETRESFGIYGNDGTDLGRFGIGLYGNTRGSRNLLNATESDLSALFGPHDGDAEIFRGALVAELAAAAGDGPRAIPADHAGGFTALGLLRENRTTVPVLTTTTDAQLHDIAGLFAPQLIRALRSHRVVLEARYRRSPYAAEISFQEFFMWWYHFFYTAVTDELARAKDLSVPPGGTITYVEVNPT